MTRATIAGYRRVVRQRAQRSRASGGHRSRIERANRMTLIVAARIVVVVVVALAIALALGGPFDWQQALGGLLPGWPWW